jgi:hypothetical protein
LGTSDLCRSEAAICAATAAQLHQAAQRAAVLQYAALYMRLADLVVLHHDIGSESPEAKPRTGSFLADKGNYV